MSRWYHNELQKIVENYKPLLVSDYRHNSGDKWAATVVTDGHGHEAIVTYATDDSYAEYVVAMLIEEMGGLNRKTFIWNMGSVVFETILNTIHGWFAVTTDERISNILGVVRSYLLDKDALMSNIAKNALADIYRENGDEETAFILTDQGIVVWITPNDNDELQYMVEDYGGVEEAIDEMACNFSTWLEARQYDTKNTSVCVDVDALRTELYELIEGT